MLCKMLFYLNFRQLKASESIGSRESRLNRNRNELQIKQLQVSAHITAMTCLLEHVGNVTVIIHTIHFTTNASWKLSTLIHEMVFYCILVPHAFLMNTSDNKYRILEYGWRNVIKNLLGARNKMTVKSKEEYSACDFNFTWNRSFSLHFIHICFHRRIKRVSDRNARVGVYRRIW